MIRHGLPEDKWQKSSYSPDNGGQCFERQMTADGLVAVGDSKNRLLGAHAFEPAVWQQFVNAVRTGTV
ncbi:DUF397 domain-containing protein [Streptomyces sp. NPDC056672]|uniref:DUF397 domain-containing protein n=1 Tax=unclassified Streptomyces TaxID=2593676 RepID=UPI0036B9DBD6|nr:DUF397 domain-containing protein [Streptomyces sp. NBC_00872]